MTENATPRSIFTLGCAAGLLILAVAGMVFGVFDGDSETVVELTFLRFEKSGDNKATVAVVRLKNRSNDSIALYPYDNLGTVCGQFITSGLTNNIAGMLGTTSAVVIAPRLMVTNRIAVTLPVDGTVGQLGIRGFAVPYRAGLLGRARELWWLVRPPTIREITADCDQEIQCPKLRPDGTVEPLRLVPAAEREP